MNSFFPDLNVWLALAVTGHPHSSAAWSWLNSVKESSRLVFSRYTQLGFVRLLSHSAAGGKPLTLQESVASYRQWLDDPRVEFRSESRSTEAELWEVLGLHKNQPAPQFAGDAYLLAFARAQGSVLVTFDKALHRFALANDYAAIIPR